ncbi:MAG: DUF3124 domain-containing protein [Chroococcidiopsidaceae cyanobacterium CP_BM_ER_R8_30]|nr:DUF3124 domain-containing protein [Chroococcidiopsidaceae cyanobacterium CP_BM_ER_R8_30]
MKLFPCFYLSMTVIILASCTPSDNQLKSQSEMDQVTPSPKLVTLDKNFKIAMCQTIYIPVYSHVFYSEQRIFNLATTLSIRNTDLTNPIIITSVRYYNSNGKLVKQYLEGPIQLNALASTNFFVQRNDPSGGFGANFIVDWVAQTEISPPIVEAVMLNAESQQGISLLSSGRVIKSQNNRKCSSTVSAS